MPNEETSNPHHTDSIGTSGGRDHVYRKVSMNEKDFINESELEDLLSDRILSDYDLPKYKSQQSIPGRR